MFQIPKAIQMNTPLKLKPDRFQNVSFEDIDSFLAQNENLNTKRKTNNDISLFRSYLQNCDENREIENL
jgi:hypothetical protein